MIMMVVDISPDPELKSYTLMIDLRLGSHFIELSVILLCILHPSLNLKVLLNRGGIYALLPDQKSSSAQAYPPLSPKLGIINILMP